MQFKLTKGAFCIKVLYLENPFTKKLDQSDSLTSNTHQYSV